MANKTFHQGKWYFVDGKGRLYVPAPDFDEAYDTYFEPDEQGIFKPASKPKVMPTAETWEPAPPPKPIVLKPGQKEYRVITQADQWFMGKFSPDRLNSLLNVLASEGWRLVAVTAADRATWFGSFGGTTRQEVLLFLERDVVTETVVKPYQETLKDAV